jgi:hypothetical protein
MSLDASPVFGIATKNKLSADADDASDWTVLDWAPSTYPFPATV